jgi:hypothetical protein
LRRIARKGSALAREPRRRHDRSAARFRRPCEIGRLAHAALYELGDDQLIGALEHIGKRLHLVPSNPRRATEQSASGVSDGNAASRQRLALTAGQLIDRMLGSNQIGHNKFVVHVDARASPRRCCSARPTGPRTGLCGQTNNTIRTCSFAAASRTRRPPRPFPLRPCTARRDRIRA